MARRIKRGDNVVILAGAEKGQVGKVLRVVPEKNRAYVEGLRMQFKHVRRSQEMPQGGRTRREYPVDLSNIAFFDAESGRGVRLGTTVVDGKKVRVMRPSGRQVEG